MKLIFLGTPLFAVPTLERCVEAGHEIAAVYTQPDRPKGRGGAVAKPPVKEAAGRLALPVYQPERIRHPDVIAQLAAFRAGAMVIVGYGQIIPQAIIDLAPLGIINLHASLLPKYRGAAPIQWAIANGETRTGITTMRINAGLDTGDMLLKRLVEIGPEETAVELSSRLAVEGGTLLVETLCGIEAGTIKPEPQNAADATFAPILRKENGRIDWNQPAHAIYNRCRGFLPWPGTYSTFRGQLFHVWRSRPHETRSSRKPGALWCDRRQLLAACGEGTVLELLEVQTEGRKRMPAEAFLNGYRLAENEALGGDA